MLKEVLSKRKKEEKHREKTSRIANDRNLRSAFKEEERGKTPSSKTSRLANDKNLCDDKSANSSRKQSRTGTQAARRHSSSDIGWDNLCDDKSANSLSHIRDKIKTNKAAFQSQSKTKTALILVTTSQRILCNPNPTTSKLSQRQVGEQAWLSRSNRGRPCLFTLSTIVCG